VLAGLGHGLLSLVLSAASKRIVEQDSLIAELESRLQIVPARREGWRSRGDAV